MPGFFISEFEFNSCCLQWSAGLLPIHHPAETLRGSALGLFFQIQHNAESEHA
jgi:hypothetical protein